MKKRRNTPQIDAGAQAAPNAGAIEPGSAVPVSEIVGEMSDLPSLTSTDSAPPADPRGPKPPSEIRHAEAPHAWSTPVLPRAANLGTPPSTSEPRAHVSASAPERKAPAEPASAPRPRRFALLAISLALCASLGAVAGSLAVTGIGHLLMPAPPAPALLPPVADASEEIRALKDSVAQLRTNVKTLGEQISSVRTALNASFSSSTAQFTKVTEAIDRLDRRVAERHAAATPAPSPPPAPAAAPDVTGSTPAGAGGKTGKPGVVEGWVLRKAYRGAALVEGRYGIIEIEPGDTLPGVGRVEEIKRQDGRWVVVTARGVIVGVQ
jgi:hypothetical protein